MFIERSILIGLNTLKYLYLLLLSLFFNADCFMRFRFYDINSNIREINATSLEMEVDMFLLMKLYINHHVILDVKVSLDYTLYQI